MQIYNDDSYMDEFMDEFFEKIPEWWNRRIQLNQMTEQDWLILKDKLFSWEKDLEDIKKALRVVSRGN